MKHKIMDCVDMQINDLSKVNAKELGEAIDMIKDLSEAIYYCTIVESMEGLEEDKEIRTSVNNITYYTNPKESKYRDMERASGYMYYPTSYNGENGWPSDMDGSSMMGRGGRVIHYTPAMADMARDPRQGRSPMRRRMYMEGKQKHNDPNTQLGELEAYLQQLSSDITEMIKDASPEEKATLRQKMNMLADKIM